MRKPSFLIWLPLALAAGACTDPEPFTRPGTWQATGANDANLRAMIANPADLQRGQAPATAARGEAAAIAAARLGAPSASGQGGENGGGGGGAGGAAGQPVRGIPALPPLSGQYVRN
ncbi:hypothetical protein DFH01_26600 [Falsiroseomonas bella]|uniref:DUF3035 domain-containing protein n=1 Tax=Falsiroseomonas bella TaxID=2184016 RepID=A0A317F4X0_9PROT|nr:hypothetical protein [Falsiroseomonas bella]PWS34200.1 hypothetical protein DFH01_26600 [Falsiroseomonas bella]